MKYYLSVFNKFAIEYLVLIMCAMFLAFAILSCDSTSSDDGGGTHLRQQALHRQQVLHQLQLPVGA